MLSKRIVFDNINTTLLGFRLSQSRIVSSVNIQAV